MTEVIIGIGGNVGDRLKNLVDAASMLNDRVGPIKEYSPVIESEPWGYESSNWFLNQVLVIESSLGAADILRQSLMIEALMGRERSGIYTDRTMDIDLLFYGDLIIAEEKLTIPHPRLHERLFILKPLVEIRPDMVHPLLDLRMWELLKACKDKTKTSWFKADHSIVLLP